MKKRLPSHNAVCFVFTCLLLAATPAPAAQTVAHDIFGRPIRGRPDLGAIEVD